MLPSALGSFGFKVSHSIPPPPQLPPPFHFLSFQIKQNKTGTIPQVQYDMSHLTPHIYDQKEDHICYPMSVSDRVSTCYRIKQNINWVLSPQIMIDKDCKNNAVPLLLDSEQELQELQHYPLRRTKSGIGVHNRRGERRYNLKKGYVAKFRTPEDYEFIVANIFREGGKRFPIAVAIKMGKLANDDIARYHYESNDPFHHPTFKNYAK